MTPKIKSLLYLLVFVGIASVLAYVILDRTTTFNKEEDVKSSENTAAQHPQVKIDEQYYAELEKQCGAADTCCKASVNSMKQGNFKKAENNSCPAGFETDNELCATSMKWCRPLPQGNKSGWNSYTSPAKYGFSIKYPNDFGFNTDYSKIQALGYIPVCDQSMAVCVYYTGDKYKGTNFENAGVSVNILKDLTTESKCYDFKTSTNEAQTFIGTFNINGIDFKSATGGQGAAGHFMKTQVYRSFHNNTCYEIAQRLGSTNIGNYPEGTVKEFNENEIWSSLRQVASTFEFAASTQLEFSLGEKVTLQKAQTAYLKGVKNVSLTLTGLTYSPCPEGAQCIWSGLNAEYQMAVGGKTYSKAALSNPESGAPYQVKVEDTDYRTYATFIVTKTAVAAQTTFTGTTVCLPHKGAQPGQPQTLECAIGLKEDGSGKYYSLKDSPAFIDTNQKVEVTGKLVGDPSSIYDIIGAIEVLSIKVVK